MRQQGSVEQQTRAASFRTGAGSASLARAGTFGEQTGRPGDGMSSESGELVDETASGPTAEELLVRGARIEEALLRGERLILARSFRHTLTHAMCAMHACRVAGAAAGGRRLRPRHRRECAAPPGL